LKVDNKTGFPMIGVFLDHWHRVTGVSHLRKDDQFSTCFFGASGKFANFGEIRFRITEGARDLGNCDFHWIVILSGAKNLRSIFGAMVTKTISQRCFASLNMTIGLPTPQSAYDIRKTLGS